MKAEELARAIAGDLGYGIPLHGSVSVRDINVLFYSAAARVALCSIWDGRDNNCGQQTVEHFKNKLVESLYAYAVSFAPFKKSLDLVSSDRLREVAEELFQMYWQTGNFYRCSSEKSHRIMAVRPKTSECEGVSFLRGVAPGQKVRMSGAGCYCSGGVGKVEDACRFFGFGEPVSGNLLETVASSLAWKPFPRVEYVEFLNTSIRPGRRSYWDVGYCDRDGLLSLARYGQKGTETYVVYRCSGTKDVEMAVLPAWRYDHPWGSGVAADYTTKEYLRLAASALSARGNLPKISYFVETRLVHVKLGYLLPVAEENFFRLYSWPENFSNIGIPVRIGNENFDQQTDRIMNADLFGVFRKMLERQGYTFVESREA